MTHRPLLALACTGALLFLGGCATTSSESTEAAPPGASERPAESTSRSEPAREPASATEKAVAERRSSSSASGSSSSSDMAKLVEQLNEAARELATLRTANAKLRAERERTTRTPAAETAPAAAPAATKADPVDERLAASLKSYAAFKQEMAALLAEVERARKSSTERSADLKTATEQVRQAKAALARAEEDLRVEKRLRLEAETNAGQLRDQLRTIARAMSDAGLSADKLTSSADSGNRGRTPARPPSRYVVREGDTLMKIADRLYGDADKWRLIMEANRSRVGADGALETGIELQIPRN
jgi:nucleoid-associated protein YgaU